jgi:hypothetical protein
MIGLIRSLSDRNVVLLLCLAACRLPDRKTHPSPVAMAGCRMGWRWLGSASHVVCAVAVTMMVLCASAEARDPRMEEADRAIAAGDMNGALSALSAAIGE